MDKRLFVDERFSWVRDFVMDKIFFVGKRFFMCKRFFRG